MRATILTVLMSPAIFCVACSTLPSVAEHWSELKPGMTKGVVVGLIGEPASTSPRWEPEVDSEDPPSLATFLETVFCRAMFDAGYERWEYGDFGPLDNFFRPSDEAFLVYFDENGRIVKSRRPVTGAYTLRDGSRSTATVDRRHPRVE